MNKITVEKAKEAFEDLVQYGDLVDGDALIGEDSTRSMIFQTELDTLELTLLKVQALELYNQQMREFIELIPNASITLDLDEHMANYKKAMKEHEELEELKKRIVDLSVKIIIGEYLEENEFSYSVVDERPSFATEKRKQKSSVKTELFEDEEFVVQTTGACGDDYYGKIARKFKGKEQWLVIDYAC